MQLRQQLQALVVDAEAVERVVEPAPEGKGDDTGGEAGCSGSGRLEGRNTHVAGVILHDQAHHFLRFEQVEEALKTVLGVAGISGVQALSDAPQTHARMQGE